MVCFSCFYSASAFALLWTGAIWVRLSSSSDMPNCCPVRASTSLIRARASIPDRRRERWFSVCDRFQASGLEFPVNSVLDRRHELFRLSEPLLDLCFLERHEVAVVAFLSELEHAGVKPAGFDGYLPRFDKVLVEQLMTPPCFADESPLVRRSAVTA